MKRVAVKGRKKNRGRELSGAILLYPGILEGYEPMSARIALHTLGLLTIILGALMLVPAVVSILYAEPSGVVAFLLSSILTLAAGYAIRRLGSNGEVEHRDAFLIVTLGWLLAAVFGALPFVLLGMGFVDSLFESMSGFTTTGATILTEYDANGYWIINTTAASGSLASSIVTALSHQLAGGPTANSALIGGEIADPTYYGPLFWRSFTQFLGGLGIILLFIAILPQLGVAGRQLYYVDSSRLTKETITPKVKNTARIYWGIYLLMVGLETFMLSFAGMPVYDSLLTAFTTIATGGFSPQASGIVAYSSLPIEAIAMLFMLLGATSFNLHYHFLYRGSLSVYARDSEFRFFLYILASAIVLILLAGGIEGDVLHRLRIVSFQVVSTMTTTGFTNNFSYDTWPVASGMVLLVLMLIGGCVGSTGGAIKVARILLILKYGKRELIEMIHPKAVKPIKMTKATIQEDIIRSILFFALLYLIVFFCASLAIALTESGNPQFDLISAVSAVATCMGGVGPGLGEVAFDFSHVTPVGKVIGVICMYVGRMEILPVLVLFLPGFWEK